MTEIAVADYVEPPVMDAVLLALMPANRLVMRVCLATGLRVSDALALTRDDMRTPRPTIREHKTGKTRRIYIPSALYDDLRKHVAGLDDATCAWVFPARTDARRHRTRQAVYKDVRRAAVAFRCSAHVSPHSARKIYAVEDYAASGDMEQVRRHLNHADAAVTMLYALADAITDRRIRRRKRRCSHADR